jgi:hypothetical protein
MQFLAIAALLSAGSRFVAGSALGAALVSVAVLFLVASAVVFIQRTRAATASVE